ISPYNSQANGIVDGDELHWYKHTHSVFWAKRVTLHGKFPVRLHLSPYFMVHDIEPLFPFNITQNTFLVPLP
ncbi:hypothetical protein BDN67DRAFT_873373, partial [Paxillus ammoniavirescens]